MPLVETGYAPHSLISPDEERQEFTFFAVFSAFLIKICLKTWQFGKIAVILHPQFEDCNKITRSLT
jgi:hypothetical protein